MRSAGIHYVRGHHRHIQAMLANDGDERRKILGHALRLDVAAGTNSNIDAVKTHVGGGAGQRRAFKKLQVLGKDRDFEPSDGGRPEQTQAGDQRGTAGKRGGHGVLCSHFTIFNSFFTPGFIS